MICLHTFVLDVYDGPCLDYRFVFNQQDRSTSSQNNLPCSSNVIMTPAPEAGVTLVCHSFFFWGGGGFLINHTTETAARINMKFARNKDESNLH